MAEMLSKTPNEAVQMYTKGIKVMNQDLERYRQVQDKEQEALCRKQISSAHASIAESYMTEPLCDEPDAE